VILLRCRPDRAAEQVTRYALLAFADAQAGADGHEAPWIASAAGIPALRYAAGMSHQGQPDWRRLLAVYWIVSAVETIGISQIYTFMPNRLADVGVANQEIDRLVGLFGSLIFVTGLPLIPFWGVWADKYSRKAVIVRSALVEAVVFAGVAASQATWQLAASMLLVGLQLGNSGVMMAALRDVTPPRRFGLAMGLFGASSAFGFGLGPVAGGIMIDQLHLGSAFVFAASAVLSLAMAVLLMLGSPDVRPEVVPSGSTFRLAFGAVRGVLADSTVRWLFLIFGIVFVGRQMSGSYLPLLVHQVEGTSLHVAGSVGVVLGGATIVGALLSPAGGWLADRTGFRPVLVVAVAGLCLAVLGLPLAPCVALIAVAYAAAIACQAVTGSMVSSLLATEVPPERRSATLNLVYLPLYIGGIAGPAIGASVVASGLDAVFYVAGAVLAGGIVVAALFARRGSVGDRNREDQAGTSISAGPT
jgi:MFS family permease